jgi:hypothetical protein
VRDDDMTRYVALREVLPLLVGLILGGVVVAGEFLFIASRIGRPPLWITIGMVLLGAIPTLVVSYIVLVRTCWEVCVDDTTIRWRSLATTGSRAMSDPHTFQEKTLFFARNSRSRKYVLNQRRGCWCLIFSDGRTIWVPVIRHPPAGSVSIDGLRAALGDDTAIPLRVAENPGAEPGP